MRKRTKTTFEIIAGFIILVFLSIPFFTSLPAFFQNIKSENQARVAGMVIGKLFIFLLIILVVKKLIEEFRRIKFKGRDGK